MKHFIPFLWTAVCLLMTCHLTGQVGIQTSSPDSTLSIQNKLEIGGTQGDIVFTDDEGSITFAPTTVPNAPMINMFASGFSNADRMVLAHSSTFPDWGLQYRDVGDEFHFVGSGVSQLAIALQTGRVGLGTQIPSNYQLAIGGNVHIETGSEAGLNSDGYLQTGSTSGQNIVIDNNEITARNNGDTATLFLNPNQGNVVVGGTSDLGAALAVEGDATQRTVRFRANGSTRFTIDSDGAVLIGSLSNKKAGYELNVDGDIVAEEVLVQNSTGWPDFVFTEDYRLMPLHEVEHLIKDQGHLPGIPSAAEVETHGILLGDMEKKLMMKIEELTLYVIQQAKDIEALRQENAELRHLVMQHVIGR